MTRSEELWDKIKIEILNEELLTQNIIEQLEVRVISGRVTQDDWSAAIDNSQQMEAEDDQ